MSNSLQPHRLYIPWNSPGQKTGMGSRSEPSPGDLPHPGIEPRSPTLQVDSLLFEPQGKPKNTGMGSLSVLQWIFPTQELNWGLLHCRRILYQLSYEGSPQVLAHPQLLGATKNKDNNLDNHKNLRVNQELWPSLLMRFIFYMRLVC